MTVVAESAAAGVDRLAVDQQFAEIYAEHYERLRRHIYYRNQLSLASLAEDFAQETFMEMYRKMLTGELIERPYGFLCFLSRQVVCHHLKLKRNTAFTAVDLDDPANTRIVATGHAYAPDYPELAATAAELDAAMDAMEKASHAWRTAHREKYKLRQALLADTQGTRVLLPERRERKQQDLAAAEALEPQTLIRFQEACRRVGVLRGEMELAGGANYRSSSGLPASAASSEGTRVGSVTSDPSITHCLAGHRLDLDNVDFSATAQRRCRKCLVETVKRYQERKGTRGGLRPERGYGRATIAVETVERARQMLLDPSNEMSISAIAQSVGVTSSVLYRRLPDALAERRVRRATKKPQQLALVSA